MSNSITIACRVHFRGRGRGNRQCLEVGPRPKPVTREPGRVPRVARLLALALRIDEQLRNGELTSYSEVAELGHVTRARVSQIMNLLNLAPDLQESILFLPRTERGRDAIILQQLQLIASILDWRKQRVLWQQLTKHTFCG
ncbi:MAG TPA: hypothetical protein VH643_15405 [Gemmataceae bacterium]